MVDPLGFDVSSTPQAIVQHEGAEQSMTRLLNAYRQDLLLPGLHLIDPDQPIPDPIGDDGKPLTLERRVEIAAGRPKYDPNGNNDYRDVGDIEPEPMGESAERAILKRIRIVRAKLLELKPRDGEIVVNTKA